MAVALNKTRMISYQIVKKCVNMSICSGTISALDGQMGRFAIEYDLCMHSMLTHYKNGEKKS